jgi:hypothetical protein
MKQITNLSIPLLKLLGSTNSYKVQTETTIGGETLTEYSEPVEIFCVVIPMQGADLRNSIQGEYTTEDKVIITDENATLKNGDILIYKNREFEVRNSVDVSDIVGIKKFVGKLL